MSAQDCSRFHQPHSILERNGYPEETYHTFSYSPSALTTALEFRPQVAILDIGLPVMDGLELARRFGEHADLRDTRLVALTGYGRDGDRAQSASAGFRAHLVKPVDPEQLRGVLDQLTR